jgi:hypothetical protein
MQEAAPIVEALAQKSLGTLPLEDNERYTIPFG